MCTEKVKSDCGCGRASGKEHRLCMTALQWDLGLRIYSHILTDTFFILFAATASCYSSVGWLEDTGCSSCHAEIKYLTPEFYLTAAVLEPASHCDIRPPFQSHDQKHLYSSLIFRQRRPKRCTAHVGHLSGINEFMDPSDITVIPKSRKLII